jgi:hypothetical protein
VLAHDVFVRPDEGAVALEIGSAASGSGGDATGRRTADGRNKDAAEQERRADSTLALRGGVTRRNVHDDRERNIDRRNRLTGFRLFRAPFLARTKMPRICLADE